MPGLQHGAQMFEASRVQFLSCAKRISRRRPPKYRSTCKAYASLRLQLISNIMQNSGAIQTFREARIYHVACYTTGATECDGRAVSFRSIAMLPIPPSHRANWKLRTISAEDLARALRRSCDACIPEGHSRRHISPSHQHYPLSRRRVNNYLLGARGAAVCKNNPANEGHHRK